MEPIIHVQVQPCPECQKPPRFWKERRRFGSMELYWYGCEHHGHLAGGVSRNIAAHNWNRNVYAKAAKP